MHASQNSCYAAVALFISLAGLGLSYSAPEAARKLSFIMRRLVSEEKKIRIQRRDITRFIKHVRIRTLHFFSSRAQELRDGNR
ncbi:hypothetical protein GGS21DRAFT_531088 [Xylaria nigripes]|nr:hypothetical protein GGS21DRAFT_531088 [Xylaria nigripes]